MTSLGFPTRTTAVVKLMVRLHNAHFFQEVLLLHSSCVFSGARIGSPQPKCQGRLVLKPYIKQEPRRTSWKTHIVEPSLHWNIMQQRKRLRGDNDSHSLLITRPEKAPRATIRCEVFFSVARCSASPPPTNIMFDNEVGKPRGICKMYRTTAQRPSAPAQRGLLLPLSGTAQPARTAASNI